MIDIGELDRAQERWQLGHHLFFGYVQALIVICSRMVDQIEAEAWDEARAEIERGTYMMWAVATTFKLAGSFSQAAYDGYVRPNMFEAADGFSGMWAQDHDFLVKKVLPKLKPVFSDPPAELAASIDTFRQSFSVMYDSHKYVCEQFEGEGPSLLMSEKAQQSAGEMLEMFKRNRLKTLGVV